METFIRELKNLIKDYEERSRKKRNVDVKNRQLCNKFILGHLHKIVEMHPDMRFMQILGNIGYQIKRIEDKRDAYFEESSETLDKIKDSCNLILENNEKIN